MSTNKDSTFTNYETSNLEKGGKHEQRTRQNLRSKGSKTDFTEKWEDNGYFHAEVDRSKKPFTIVMPPPNITGQLHMGHALDNTMQDILIRYKRMQGYNALWQPGTDHAAIATEVKVIKLKKAGNRQRRYRKRRILENAGSGKRVRRNIINQLEKAGFFLQTGTESVSHGRGMFKAVQKYL